MSEWIDVNERLPDDMRQVLVVDDDQDVWVGYYYVTKQRCGWYVENRGATNVIYWSEFTKELPNGSSLD